MLTGSNARTDVARAREAGAPAYVTKDRIAAAADRARSASWPPANRWYPGRAMLQLVAVFHVSCSDLRWSA